MPGNSTSFQSSKSLLALLLRQLSYTQKNYGLDILEKNSSSKTTAKQSLKKD